LVGVKLIDYHFEQGGHDRRRLAVTNDVLARRTHLHIYLHHRSAVAYLVALNLTPLVALAYVDQHTVSDDQVNLRDLVQNEGRGEIAPQTALQVEAGGHFPDAIHPHRLGEADGHHVARLLDAEAQGARPVEAPRVIGRLPFAQPGPLVDHDRRVEQDAGRGEA